MSEPFGQRLDRGVAGPLLQARLVQNPEPVCRVLRRQVRVVVIEIRYYQLPQPAPVVAAPRRKYSLTIDINTDSGQISGMPFEQATSQIVMRENALVIGPIHFRLGAGEGLGQVLIIRQKNGSSLLKISGHLNNCDSQVVYHQLLKRPGLVSGKLSGNFYLEGITGKQFLPTSLGAFSMRIEDGRLNKLTGLAKILHILNILPLLTENVQGKGLPYKKITFNIYMLNNYVDEEHPLKDNYIEDCYDAVTKLMIKEYRKIFNVKKFFLKTTHITKLLNKSTVGFHYEFTQLLFILLLDLFNSKMQKMTESAIFNPKEIKTIILMNEQLIKNELGINPNKLINYLDNTEMRISRNTLKNYIRDLTLIEKNYSTDIKKEIFFLK